MKYEPVINYVVAAGIALGAAFTSRTAGAEESSPLEKVVCTYDSVQGSLCSCPPAPKKITPKPNPITCEQKCETEYQRVHERNCGKDLRALQEYHQELERSGSRLGISWPSDRYSGCLVPITQNRRFCLDACEEGHPEKVDRMIRYKQCTEKCYDSLPHLESYIDQIQREKKRLGVKRRLSDEQMEEFERNYHQKERERDEIERTCLQGCGKNPNPER